ncbi:hypothetical protein ACH5RR_039449 [Cinchona calisaya]|uniref:CRC domain-containing protein n=1 Tax=Cinchona calisaya TaxID=153742 RepID=A0ABD2Y013_9GENT
MDYSPEQPSKLSNSDPTLQVQESPVFSYISNLSPIKPDKAAPAAQGFPGINSPALVLRSPQINPNSQPNFLKRPQFSGSTNAGLSEQDESCGGTVTVPEESGISTPHLSSGLRTCPQKAFIAENSTTEKVSNPTGNADDYLTKIVNMDGGDSTSSTNLSPKSSDVVLQSQNDLSDSKESVEETEDKDGSRNMKMGAPLAMLEQAEEGELRNSSSDVKSVVQDQKSGDGNMPYDLFPKVESDKSVDHVLENQHGEHSETENAGSGHVFEVGSASLSESMRVAQGCGSSPENEVTCSEALENKMNDYSPKVVQHHHGISRRLQFEDVQGKLMANMFFRNSSGSTGHLRSPASPDSEVPESASLNEPASPSNRLLANMTPPIFSPQNIGNYNVKFPKRSGIGLHLNSIVNSMQMGSGAKVRMKSADHSSFDGLDKKSISIMSCDLHKDGSISSNLEGASKGSDGSKHDKHTSVATNSASYLSPYSKKPIYEPVFLKPIELQSYSSDKRMYNSETSNSLEDFGQSSPKKKRKKLLDTGESNGCKRCNCKKTKCLKLYCDCFAAGIYCAEPCACQGCFNRPEYEDTVLETRQQIESRNPLAFAPKIIQHLTEPPTDDYVEDGANFTPSSSRHKRGCNCKKSKCLKKYCECYQNNVGCSDGCRCEACENIYGRKGVYQGIVTSEFGMIKDLISKHSEKLDSSFDTTPESVASKDGLLHNEPYNPHNLTPLTPSFQCSDHGKDASKSWLSSGGYLQSPESGLTFIAPYGTSPEQATNPDNHNMILESNTGIMDLVSFGQHLDYGNGNPVNQFSPKCDTLRNAGDLTALPNPQVANISRAQFFPGNRQVSSGSSLRWRSSPNTPSTQFGGTKLHEVVDFNGRLYSNMDDDSPEILKETPVPSNAVKISSPNKKRVSPPHGRGTELGSCSSGLRNARKFILQSVPHFPPFTPCIDSKSGTGMHNLQSSSSSK